MTTHLQKPNKQSPRPTDNPSLPGNSSQQGDQADAKTFIADNTRATEWIDHAIPPGSSRYYAILHADRSTHSRLQGVISLISIWSQLAFSSHETEISLRKADWWRTELAGEHLQHPLTRLLEPHFDNDSSLASHLADVLAGYTDLIQFGSPSTDEANKLFHWSTGALACLALTGVENTVNNPVARAGVALSRFRCLRCLPRHVGAKLLCLPMTALEANNLSPAQLQPGSADPMLADFFTQQLQALNKEMELTASELLHAGTASRPLYIYLRAQQTLLTKLLKKDAHLMQSETRLSPIRNYFIAFKAARQHYRHN